MQIVLARLEEDQEVIKVGRIDLGERHTFRAIARPVSLMWANEAINSDLAKAQAFAKREGYTVFRYTGEEDPLGRARREILT